jgi:hypothetical protein
MTWMWSVQTRKAGVFALTGVVLGLAQYGYYGSRGLLIVMAVLTFREMCADPRWALKNRWNLLALGSGFVVAWLPQAIVFAERPQEFIRRVQGVSVWSDNWLQKEAALLGQSELAVLVSQMTRSLLVLVSEPMRAFFTGRPILEPIASVLFVAGTLVLLTKARDRGAFAVLASGLVIVGLQALTIDVPNGARLVMICPLVCLIVAMGLWTSTRLIAAGRKVVAHTIIAAFLLYSATSGLRYYVLEFPSTNDLGAVPSTELGYFMRDLPPGTRVQLLGEPRLNCSTHASRAFIAGPRECLDVPPRGTTGVRSFAPSDVLISNPQREGELLGLIDSAERYELQRIISPIDHGALFTVYLPRAAHTPTGWNNY